MSFEMFPGVGMVHLQTVAPARVVPGHQRHRWANKRLLRGQTTSCDKCGCVKTLTRDYEERFRMPGQPELRERPNCTGVQRPTTSQTA